MNETLELQARIVFGKVLIYPISDNAKEITALIGRKTFTQFDVTKLQKIGFSIKWIIFDPMASK